MGHVQNYPWVHEVCVVDWTCLVIWSGIFRRDTLSPSQGATIGLEI